MMTILLFLIEDEVANKLLQAQIASFLTDICLIHRGTLGQVGIIPKSYRYRTLYCVTIAR